jgi:hypothetical protein
MVKNATMTEMIPTIFKRLVWTIKRRMLMMKRKTKDRK